MKEKIRILRKNIYVSASAQKGWGKDSLDKYLDVIQYWDDKEGWVDLPVVRESTRIYKNNIETDKY